jgi:hypothetical protein
MDMNHSSRSNWSAYSRMVFIGFIVIAAVLLAYEHRLHLSGLLGLLPFLFLLACPLMHLFMHNGHGHDGHDGQSGIGDNAPRPLPTEKRDA